MTTNTAEFLQEQKRLAEAATEGWRTFETSWDRNALGVENDADEMVFWEAGGGITVAYPHDAEFIAAARSSVPKLLAAVEAVMAMHTDGGSSQGYFKEGGRWEYTSKERCCVTCGTHGEYGVEWPCPTIRAIEAALGGEGE